MQHRRKVKEKGWRSVLDIIRLPASLQVLLSVSVPARDEQLLALIINGLHSNHTYPISEGLYNSVTASS